MKAKTINTIPTFNDLYNEAPMLIKDYIDRCKDTAQGVQWHPEGDVQIHTRLVYDRAREFGNLNLALTAFFHDLGKVDTSAPNKHGGISALGHENVSARLANRYADWILELGGDPEQVENLVQNHMRIKLYHNMRDSKRKLLEENPYFDELNQFTKFDDMSTLTHEEMNRYK